MSVAEAYRVLDLNPGTDSDAVHARYRLLALRYHPDRNGDNPASLDRFKQLASAYRLLRAKFRLDSGYSQALRAECERCGEYAILHAGLDGSHCCAACLSLANRRPLLPAPPITIVTCAATITLLVLAFGCLLASWNSGAGVYSILALILGLLALASLAAVCLTVIYTAEPRQLRRQTVQSVRRTRPAQPAGSTLHV
jgi:hypothetical protein